MTQEAIKLNLHPRQMDALTSTANEVLYGGAAGGGKSHLLRVIACMFCYMVPNIQVYLFRRTHKDLLKNHMDGPTSFLQMLAPLIDLGLVRPNHSDGRLAFWNGAAIHLCHCQHEKDRFNYQGPEIHVLLIDELTHFTDLIYRYLRGRVRMGGLTIPQEFKDAHPQLADRLPMAMSGSNPGGVGHNWVKATFVKGCKPMETRSMGKAEGGMMRQYVPAKLADNPTMTANDPDYADRLEGLGNPALVRAMLDGDWDIVSGGMFDDLWDKTKHVIEPFDIPKSWRVYRSFDWGSSAPFSVGWWAESDGTRTKSMPFTFPRGSKIHIAEWYGWNGKPNEGIRMTAREIARGIIEREKFMPYSVKAGPADSAIYDTQNGNCIADDMAAVGVRWERADKSPGSRKNGAQLIRQLLKSAAAFPPEEPGLWTFDTCRHFIDQMPVIPRSEKNPEDVDTDAEDHIWDETRYAVSMPKREMKRTKLRA